MDSRIGLDYIVENPEYIGKLAAALDTPNVTVKKQVFELLSALCVYNTEGYARALDTLEHYKNLKGERYRLNVIIVELDRATQVDYQTALVAFINCVIISTPRLSDRIRLRNEFIGLNLLPVLNNVRGVAASVPDLGVQLDVFDEQRDSDDAQSLQGPHGINLNSHLDVFYAILAQIATTPQEIPFLSILQHLLRLDPKEAVSDIIWDTAETLVHRATLLENREDASRLLRAPSVQTKFGCQYCRNDSICSPNRKQSLGNAVTPNTPITVLPPPPPPPPAIIPPPPGAPPLPRVLSPPPPPPPPLSGERPGGPPVCPPMAPPLLKPPSITPSISPEPLESSKLLPQQATPAPKRKMRSVNWNKIPDNKVVGKNNIWSNMASSHQHSPMADLDWAEMEGLFCQQVPPSQGTTTQGSPRLGRDSGHDSLDRRSKKETSEITLLDGKRSLNINIFLKQFRSSNEDIIQLIKDGEHDDIGAEKLRGLLKILPEVDELDMLKSFDGDRSKLGNAENFLLQLMQLSNYKLRIESMLLKEEFQTNMGYLNPSILAMIYAGEDLMNNKPLQEVLYMVLVAGNFLNSGGYAGNAAGVKLASLQKLTDIRANKPGMNLIHYVALQAEKKNKELLLFPDDMTELENASKTTIEQLHNEINTLEARIKKIKKQIDLPTTEIEIKEQMSQFLQGAEQEVAALQRNMEELEGVRKSLSEFFCEDPGSFKLEECFRVFQQFCLRFRQAVAENERRRVQEEQAQIRRRQREEQLASKRRQMGGQVGTPTSDSDNNLVDSLLYDIRTGFPQRKGPTRRNGTAIPSEEEASLTGSPAVMRRRISSVNSNGQLDPNNPQDTCSPDVTPNGSLRRRRSRGLSEEDEGLMDFLRASGHDSTRERKSWGSLDRSWARRARGVPTRKRPDLLNADFSGDRERPNSPSPLAESKPLPTEDTKPKYIKEWRQKIESWLQANEKEDQQHDDLRRRARKIQSNRRSLENDSESERSGTLDTLPEGKLAQTGDIQYKRVYSDWKPSTAIDKTDVVRTMEAIEEAQPQVKDKSAWRKSTLNVPNSTEETELDLRRLRRQRSRPSLEGSGSGGLKSIAEEDKRKNIIASLGERPASDKLSLYIRRPSDPVETEARSPTITRSQTSTNNQQFTKNEEAPPSIPRRLKRYTPEEITNKTEIDSDNIETPPATRRVFSPTGENPNKPATPVHCRRLQIPRQLHRETSQESKMEEKASDANGKDIAEVLGDGQFDRFSPARRTRRCKRSTDYSSSNDEVRKGVVSPEAVAETQVLRPSQLQVENSYPVNASSNPVTETNDKESRLRKWQERLRIQDRVVTPEPAEDQSKNTNSRLVRHRMTGINQEDVRKAIRELKSPLDNQKVPTWPRPTSLKIEKTSNDSNESKRMDYKSPTYKINASTDLVPEIKLHVRGQKIRTEHELNDEGFEETQSLVSESPSQGTSSGCNYETDGVDSSRIRQKPMRIPSTDSTGTVETNSSDPNDPSTRTKEPTSKVSSKARAASEKLQSLIDRNKQSLERSRSMRSPNTKNEEVNVRRSVIPRRSNSLRKTDSQNSVIQRRNGVERSNSRTSLRSSRSSLNSSASVNTVKKVPVIKSPLSRITPEKRLIIKQPLPQTQTKVRVPASRSSSSGSSIGPSVRKPPIRSALNTSFKENQSQNLRNKINVPASRSSSSGSSVGLKTPISRIPSTTRTGFMRPTTSSSTKTNGLLKPINRPGNVK